MISIETSGENEKFGEFVLSQFTSCLDRLLTRARDLYVIWFRTHSSLTQIKSLIEQLFDSIYLLNMRLT